MSRNLSSQPPVPPGSQAVDAPPIEAHGVANVVALNDESALYLTLVSEIQGAAIGLSPRGQALLRQGLAARFGDILRVRGDDAVEELVRLAIEPLAA